MHIVKTLLMVLMIVSVSAHAESYTSEMRNKLTHNGSGEVNPAYNNMIKNIMIFQIGGWSGLPHEQDAGLKDPTWPLHWGKQGYLEKSPDIFLWQMHEIQNMSKNMAIAVLFMPAEEYEASGYGACWDGEWVDHTNCINGQWKTPQEIFHYIKWAAWMKGIQVAPLISINNFESSPVRSVKEKLVEFVEWYMDTVDLTSLTTVGGKVVILTEGLPRNTDLSNEEKNSILEYMGSKKEIFWIDNLVNSEPWQANENIYRSAATFDRTGSIQDGLKNKWGDRYLWHFVNRKGIYTYDMWNANNKIPEDIRLKWLNITPHDANRYPVIISQWNEYSEFHVFEPSEFDNYSEYDYLRWRLGQQP